MTSSKRHENDKAVANAPETPAQDERELREKFYKESYDELVKKQISNADNFDRSILTLSASGLGLSLAFIKDISSINNIVGRCLLVTSWGLFGAATISTIASFMTSQFAIRFQMDAAKKYYLESNEEYLDKRSYASKATEGLNFFSGIAFISAIILTIIFVTMNLPHPPKI